MSVIKTRTLPALMKRIRALAPHQRDALRAALAADDAHPSSTSGKQVSPSVCPRCGADSPLRYGRVRGQQRWRCVACRRTFGALAGTPLVGLRHKSEWQEFGEALSRGLTVAEAAIKCGIHRNTAFRWRRRLLSASPRLGRRSQNRSAAARAAPDGRVLRSRRALRASLLKLMEAKQFDQITIRQITAEAGVSYATFFRHHTGKHQLLDEIAAEEVRGLLARALPLVEKFPADTSSSLTLCEYVDEHRGLWGVLLNGGAAPALKQECIRVTLEYAEARKGIWLPLDLGSLHGASASIEILAWWLRSPRRYPPERIAAIIDHLVVAPLICAGAHRG
jgi:transposase-like protein/AcrR family transcriptional regulator